MLEERLIRVSHRTLYNKWICTYMTSIHKYHSIIDIVTFSQDKLKDYVSLNLNK